MRTAIALLSVIEHQSIPFGDDDPGQAVIVQHVHDLLYSVLCQVLQRGERGGNHGSLVLQRSLFCPDNHVLGDKNRIGIQENQDKEDQADIGQGNFKPQAAPDGYFQRIICLL